MTYNSRLFGPGILLLVLLLAACGSPAPAEQSAGVTLSPAEEQSSAVTAIPTPTTAVTTVSVATVTTPAGTAASNTATAGATASSAAQTATPAAPDATTVQAAPTPQRVLYLRFNYPEQRDELRSVAVDGSDDRVVWACVAACDITGLALSPDGNSLAFTVRGPREPEALFIADVEVKNFVTLPGSAALTPQTWSADGEWLAFAGERSADPAPVGERSIWIVNRAGDSSTQLTPWAFFVGPPLWLDDQHLLFSRAATGTPPTGWQIYRVDTAGNMQIERMADGEIVEASPDRTSVLAMVETIPNDPVHRALTLIPLDGGEPRRIAENLNPNATWAPDGKSFVYFNPQSSSIVQVQADDGSATDLWTIEDIGNFPFVQLAWDPRGAYLFFSVTGTGTTELRRLDMEARTVQTLLSYEGDPQPMVVTP